MRPTAPRVRSPAVAPPRSIAEPPRAQVLQGIAFMLAFAAVAPWIDVAAKLLSGSVAPVVYVAVRFAAQGVTLFVLLAVLGRRLRPAPGTLPLHAVRGAAMAVAATLFITAVQAMPLADAMAIFFVAPLLLTAISGLVLGEPVGPRRLAACATGFVGALVVVRPSFLTLGPVALLPLAAAGIFVGYLLVTRRLSRYEGPILMQAWAGLAGGATMVLALALWPVPLAVPRGADWALVLAGAAAAIVSHLFLVAAFSRAPAPLLAPLQYLELATMAVAGLVLFGDFPDPLTWVGIAIIVGSGLYVIWREARVSGRPAP